MMLKKLRTQGTRAGARRTRLAIAVLGSLVATLTQAQGVHANASLQPETGERTHRSRLTVGGRLHLQPTRESGAAPFLPTKSASQPLVQALNGQTPPWAAKTVLQDDKGQAGDFFGDQVAIYGDTMVIGAWGSDDAGKQSGAAFVAKRQKGQWAISQALVPSQPLAEARFGYSVAVHGDWIAVSSVDDSTGGIRARGSVELYRRDPSTQVWAQAQKILVSDASAGDSFGFSLSFSAGWLAVGTPNYDGKDRKDQGAVYLYRLNGTKSGWDFVQRLDRGTQGDGQADQLFGAAVSLSQNRLAVGAPGDDTRALDAGAVYIYEWNQEGKTWEAKRKIVAEFARARDAFGQALALDGTRCLIGSPGADDPTLTAFESGAAHLFEKVADKDDWSLLGTLRPAIPKQSEFFGLSVALEPDAAAVGAFEERSRVPVAGRALLYARARVGGAWSQVQEIAPGRAGEGFGFGLALDRGWLAVGAFLDGGAPGRSGRVYTYNNPPLSAPVLGGVAGLVLLVGVGYGVGRARRG